MEARLPIDLCFTPPPEEEGIINYNLYAFQLQDRLTTSFKLAQETLKLSQERQAEEYDKKAWRSPFKAGDGGWLFNTSTPQAGESPDWAPSQCLNGVNYPIQREGHTMQCITITLNHHT